MHTRFVLCLVLLVAALHAMPSPAQAETAERAAGEHDEQVQKLEEMVASAHHRLNTTEEQVAGLEKDLDGAREKATSSAAVVLDRAASSATELASVPWLRSAIEAARAFDVETQKLAQAESALAAAEAQAAWAEATEPVKAANAAGK